MSDEKPNDAGMTRLSFLKTSAGAAAGVAAVSVPGAAAAREHKAPRPTDPSAPTPREPVVAYVRSAERGEVTVVSGTSETTYRDHALARRLMKAAQHHPSKRGGGNVLAS